jgi:hypothetical protein
MRNPPTEERVRELCDRLVSREEVRRARDEPLSAGERDSILELVRWFRRRYPTGAERLAYVRRAYARWMATSRTSRGRPALPDTRQP